MATPAPADAMKPLDKVALKYLGPDLFHSLAENKALAAKFEMLLMMNIAVVVMIVLLVIYHYYKLHAAKKAAAAAAKSSFEDGQKAQGVMVLPPQSLINRISGSTVSAHQGSVAAGGLFEHDLPTVQQNSPMTGPAGPKLHCAPDEIEGISMVIDAQTGEQIRVVNCYDSAGVLQPPRPRDYSAISAHKARMFPKPRVEPEYSQSPTMDCNGVWDFGAEGELGAQSLMGNTSMAQASMAGEREMEHHMDY
jgi:hypothetical protein